MDRIYLAIIAAAAPHDCSSKRGVLAWLSVNVAWTVVRRRVSPR